jgi:hypothetical protein
LLALSQRLLAFVNRFKPMYTAQQAEKALAVCLRIGPNGLHMHQQETATMARSRQRLADFEARSVQIIAACTLGLAGMSALQATPAYRASGASTPTLTSQAPATSTSPRNLVQRTGAPGVRDTERKA